MLFAKKEKQVTKMILEHYEKVLECLEKFKDTVIDYIGSGENYRELSYETHLKEHEADEIRRKIQVAINEGAFLPFYRSDFVELVEMIDKIANRAKTVTQEFTVEEPAIPDDIKENITELCNISIKCFKELKQVVTNLLNDKELVLEGTEKVSEIEQAADSVEWKTLKTIFQSKNLDLANKMMLKNIIVNLSEISDVIENTADRCLLIITKQVT